MKLYTEEQVIKAMDFARGHNKMTDSQFIDLLTPIELPSDEEIEEQGNLINDLSMRSVYILGSKSMRDKIQGGDK